MRVQIYGRAKEELVYIGACVSTQCHGARRVTCLILMILRVQKCVRLPGKQIDEEWALACIMMQVFMDSETRVA